MLKNAVLIASTSLEAGLDESHRAWVRLQGRPRVSCGPQVFEIIGIFREPRPIEKAVEILAARATGATALVEAMAIVDLLYREGVLVDANGTRRAVGQLSGFSAAPEHIAMLNDRTRTSAFLTAIEGVVRPGDVVVDLGSGTGVLAMAAARAGASRVYAIEAGAMADCAEQLFRQNGVGDRVTLVRQWSTEVELDERADVLITETLGNDPWAEGILALVSDARRRYLKPGARIVPSLVRWLAQPVAIPIDRQEGLRFSSTAANRWRAWYGFDFDPLVAAGDEHTGAPFLRQQDVAEWSRVSPPIPIAEVELAKDNAVPQSCRGRVVATQDGVIDGALLCWESVLAERTTLSTLPGAANIDSSWRVRLLLLRDPVAVRKGCVVTLSLERQRPPRLSCVVDAVPVRDIRRR